ncbi:MAG: hypothetical protein RCG15_01865 [Candidatus Rickettsia vulgarisii]
MKIYSDKTFVITKDQKPIVVSFKDIQIKELWLKDTAEEEFNDSMLRIKKQTIML